MVTRTAIDVTGFRHCCAALPAYCGGFAAASTARHAHAPRDFCHGELLFTTILAHFLHWCFLAPASLLAAATTCLCLRAASSFPVPGVVSSANNSSWYTCARAVCFLLSRMRAVRSKGLTLVLLRNVAAGVPWRVGAARAAAVLWHNVSAEESLRALPRVVTRLAGARARANDVCAQRSSAAGWRTHLLCLDSLLPSTSAAPALPSCAFLLLA
jgi:hypothetical protein